MDGFDPKDENALMRVPVAPFVNDSITSSLCLKKEELSRKRKRKSLDATPTARGQADAEQVASPTEEPKKSKRDAGKTKKTRASSTDKDAKNGEKGGRKKAGKSSTEQGDMKRSKGAAKKAKGEKSPRTAESAETGEASPSSAFRPHYDSVFSR